MSAGRALRRTLASWYRDPSGLPCATEFLKPEELRWFWAATEQIGEPFGALLKLLLLTGCRREEVAGLRWSELSEDGMTWNIPSMRTKNWREHIVPFRADPNGSNLATERCAPLVVQGLVLLRSSVRRKPLLECLSSLDEVGSRLRIHVDPHDRLCLVVECIEQPR